MVVFFSFASVWLGGGRARAHSSKPLRRAMVSCPPEQQRILGTDLLADPKICISGYEEGNHKRTTAPKSLTVRVIHEHHRSRPLHVWILHLLLTGCLLPSI